MPTFESLKRAVLAHHRRTPEPSLATHLFTQQGVLQGSEMWDIYLSLEADGALDRTGPSLAFPEVDTGRIHRYSQWVLKESAPVAQ